MSLDNATAIPTSTTTNPQLKRKRDEPADTRIAVDNISLGPTGSATSDTGRIFAPACLLPRAQLPLAWLDPAGDGVQMLNGSIKLFEREGEASIMVLIAKDVITKRYWAVERAAHQRFALCRLASSIERRVLEKRACARYEVTPKAQGDRLNARPELQRKRQNLLTPPPHASSPLDARMDLPEAVESSTLQPTVNSVSDRDIRNASNETQQANNQDTCLQEVLQELSKHYLDALYLSRTSVAYFVKGPLSRARNAVNDTLGSALHSSGLSAFLREMLLTTSASDKRMKDVLPTVLKELTARTRVEEGEPIKNRKTKWKPKRDRQGFLSDEKRHVEQWWQAIDQDTPVESLPVSWELHVSQKLQYLRSRETFLQVIILLETMAIESSSADMHSQYAGSLEPQINAQADKKRRRPLDLATHLEGLLDRLTIWHSLDFRSPQKKTTEGSQRDDEPEVDDELKSFCVEVVVPFYMSRLPKMAAFVNKRLGGPSAPTPLKRTTSGRPGEPAGRPGEPAQRQARSEKKARRSLHRVATDSMIQSSKTPSLHRSATDSQLQDDKQFKRESSVSLSLHSIPLARSDSQRRRPNALASLSRREIDLTAVSLATDSKLRKKAEQEARVKEAVASIRRPDRALALKENAARVDASFTKSLPGLKRNHSGQHSSSIHIAATPNASRVVAATPRKQGGIYSYRPVDAGPSAAYLAPPDAIANLSTVPQTGHRDRVISFDMTTPSNQRYKFQQSSTLVEVDPTESPVVQRSSRVDCTPSRPRALFSLTETPIAGLTSAGMRTGPMSCKSVNVVITTPTIEKSVYDTLGWNDEAYEELA